MLALGDGHLVDRQEVVGGGVGVVDHGGLRAADRAAGGPVLDIHPLDEHAVEGAVAGLEGRALGAGQLAEGVIERVEGQVRVEPRERVAQPLLQHDGAVAGALLTGRTGADVGAVRGLPAEGTKPLKGGFLDFGFGNGGHGCDCSALYWSTTTAIVSSIASMGTTIPSPEFSCAASIGRPVWSLRAMSRYGT